MSIPKKFQFQREPLEIIIQGKSSLDSTLGLFGYPFSSREDVERFVTSYGFDLNDPIQNAEIRGNYQEALNFIRRYFLTPQNPDGLQIEIPKKILDLAEISDLFFYATSESEMQLRGWACSILKVMHTIAHMDRDLRSPYFAEIQKQILDRFYKLIHRDETGQLYLGELNDSTTRVDLVQFETKPKKPRDSMLIKLLHKPENVAEEVFDRVGLRFITKSRLDALRVVQILKDQMVIMPPNIKPSRSRNSLVDLSQFFATLNDLTSVGATEAETINRLNSVGYPEDERRENIHTSKHYKSIQFTARSLIRLTNPVFENLREIKHYLKSEPQRDAELARLYERIDLKHIQKEVRFFYPYEVQIVDQESYRENEVGLGAHSEYKKAQLKTAMKRVMGDL